MSKKEALPKAAFQYGVKMNEGRKTRGKMGAKNDKAKLDKEWNKISALIDKRKTTGGGGSSSKKPKI
jgi:IK cytokine